MGEGASLRIRLVPSATGGGDAHYATSYLVNETLAVDAGALGYYASLERQGAVRHVIVSHTHADHVASLPILLENAWGRAAEPIVVWGGPEVLDSLRRDHFNDRVWPRLELLEESTGRPFARLRELEAERPVRLGDLVVTPVPVHHTVPTFGFLIEAGGRAVLLSSDTGPTDRLWEVGCACPHLAAVFLEASFPDEEAALAAASGHLTPRAFAAELAKLERPVPTVAVHIKARWREETERQLRALALPEVEIGVADREYAW